MRSLVHRRTARSFLLPLLGATALFGALVGCSAILGFDKSVEEQRAQRPDGGSSIDDGGGGEQPQPQPETDGAPPVLQELRGELDPTFGGDGSGYVVASSDISGTANINQCGAALDGKTRVIAVCASDSSSTSGTAVFRFDAAGLLDPSFGAADGGGASFPGFTPNIALQSDDRVILAGYRYVTPADGGPSFFESMLQRLSEDGALDTSVGDHGNMLANVYPRDSYAGPVVVSSGKAVVVGAAGYYDNLRFQAPYLAVVDLSSGHTDRVVISDVAGNHLPFEPLSIVSTKGSSVVAFGRYGGTGGSAFVPGWNTTSNVALAHFVDGNVDPSFGDGGIEAVKVPVSSWVFGSAWMESSGDVATVAGNAGAGTNFFRIRTGGDLDTTIGDAGMQRIPAPPANPKAGFRVTTLVPTLKGKFLVAGEMALPASTNSHAFVARLLADGTVDPTFGDKGYVELVAGIGKNESIDAIVPLQDGRVLAVGRSLNEQGNWDVFVARYR